MEGKNAFGGQNNNFQTPTGRLSTSEQINRRRSCHEAQIMKTSSVQGEQSIGMGFPCSKLLVTGASLPNHPIYWDYRHGVCYSRFTSDCNRMVEGFEQCWSTFFWLYTPVFQRTEAPCNWSRSCSASGLCQVDVFHHSLSGGSGCLMYQGWANVVANQWCNIIF